VGKISRRQWLTPVIPATQEAEIRRIEIQSQPRQIVPETLSQNTHHKKKKKKKKGFGGVAQGEGLSSNPTTKKKTKYGQKSRCPSEGARDTSRILVTANNNMKVS
jgi:hypothetical protein